MKRYLESLVTLQSVPIYDATQIFDGKRPDLAIDFSKISETCKILKGEVKDGDFVALLHSIYFTNFTEDCVVNYGIYAVVLLAKETDAVSD